MGLTSHKNRLIKDILKKSISLNSIGCIEFKGKLKDEINKRNISNEDALLIVLDILFNVTENKLTNFNEIPFYFSLRIKKVKKFNNNFNSSKIDLKIKKFFNHKYDFEKGLIKKYVSGLEERFNIKNKEVIEFNKTFINNIKYSDLNIKKESVKKKNITIKQKKSTYPERNKINLDHLNKTDLCYILDLNPDLTFEKSKVLRNQVIENLLNLHIDDNNINNASRSDLKKFLEPHREKEKQKELEKKKLKDLISNVKAFNNKSFSHILSSKKEYLEIYNQISENYCDIDEYNLNTFKSYYEYVNKTEMFKSIENEVILSEDLIKKFNSQIFDNYLNNTGRTELKTSFNEIYKLYIKINELPNFLKNKLYETNNDLKNAIEIFNDLDNYTSISDSHENNKIRIHNEQILDKKINENKEFFEDITDVSKKRAIVMDEQNVKVLAGAGTGKTFTIQKKVKYLIEILGLAPEKILCLCYTNKGANDLDKKVNSDLIDTKVEVCTFHEFCRRVDRKCGGKKSTNRYLLDSVIRNYIKEIVDDEEKINRFTEYFSYYIIPQDNTQFDTYNELLHYENDLNLKTLKEKYYEANNSIFSLQGEIVKSIGELIIANYLFMHEIDYEYERNYNHSFVDILKRFLFSGTFLTISTNFDKSIDIIVNEFIENEHKWERYNPDFYLPEYDIYLEHFGIGKSDNEKWLPIDYEKQMQDKLLCHEMHGTKLIKTYYYFLEEGRLIEELERLLIENDVIIGKRNQKEVLDLLIATNKIDDYQKFNKLVKTFINIFEARNKSKNDFESFKEITTKEKYGYTRKRQEVFFDIVSDIYNIYCEKNNGDIIDHNREISNALDLIQSKKYNKSYDYILIDEYQDINEIRCKLLHELQKNSNCKIFVVGDDWQSIYMFNGSDVNLFIDFDKYFPNSETIKLEENRRNPPLIIDISSKFILKNKNQEEKNLRYFKQEIYPNLNPIKIVKYWDFSNYYKDKITNKILKLDAIIQHILKNNSKQDLKILLLGRTNKDINKLINNALFKEKRSGKFRKILYSRKLNLDITYMTIHQAKGLEYDEVIIINFENNINGFPNQIDDDPLLKFVKSYEKYPFAEERRLMYVALTRTLNNVYLLAPQFDDSIFIEELIKDYNIKELELSIDTDMEHRLYDDSDFFQKWEYHHTNVPCPNCDGHIVIVVNNQKQTKYVRCSNHAVPNPSHYDGGPIPYYYDKYDVKYIEKCPSCRGVLIRHGDVLKCCLNSHGCVETKELKLDKEDMEYNE